MKTNPDESLPVFSDSGGASTRGAPASLERSPAPSTPCTSNQRAAACRDSNETFPHAPGMQPMMLTDVLWSANEIVSGVVPAF